jgi:hypothetical protein
MKQFNLTLKDADAAKLRRGLLDTAEKIEHVATATTLAKEPEKRGLRFTHEVAEFWRAPFELTMRAHKDLEGLSNIGAYVALNALRGATSKIQELGPFNQPHEEMPATWQTPKFLDATNALLVRPSEVTETCRIRLRTTEPLNLFEGAVELLKIEPYSDPKTLLLKDVILGLIERVHLHEPAESKASAEFESEAQKLAGLALAGLDAPAPQRNPGTRQEVFAPLCFESVRKLYEHPLIRERAARS